jgi:hypothetical protein
MILIPAPRRDPSSSPLVPKLHLGTHRSPEVELPLLLAITRDYAAKLWKHSFGDKRVPKCNLGTRIKIRIKIRSREANRASFCLLSPASVNKLAPCRFISPATESR